MSTPYLSVVVTTRNDDHGGDPLKRLQALVNCFDEQCRRTGLDAEVIVVEWNPPADRPRVQSLLRWPEPCYCTYRFVDVPADVHASLKYSDVLPLFQMIAKNVGIRRARGRFVMATNIDIIFSNELIEFLASGQLEPGYMYRVDRHDIEAAVPLHAGLEEQLAYCENHQLRVHARWGSYAVDPRGQMVALLEDIVDGRTVTLGTGWHVREGTSVDGFYRWARNRADVQINRSDDPFVSEAAALDIEVEPNPFDPGSPLELEIVDDSGALISRVVVAHRRTIRVPVPGGMRRGGFELRWIGSPDARPPLAIFERRGAMHYRVRSIVLKTGDQLRVSEAHSYSMRGWQIVGDAAHEPAMAGALAVVTGARRWSYAAEYGPLLVPETGTYRFMLRCDVLEGDVTLGVLGADRREWLSSSVEHVKSADGDILTITARLEAGRSCLLVMSNDYPHGDGITRFVIKELSGTAAPATLMPRARPDEKPKMATDAASSARAERSGAAVQRRREVHRRRRLLTELAEHVERRNATTREAAEQALKIDAAGWRPANLSPDLVVAHTERGVSVVSDRRKASYCIEYGPLTAPATGVYHFSLLCDVTEGGVELGPLSGDRQVWLKSAHEEVEVPSGRDVRMSVKLREGDAFWLVLSNKHPDGDGVSKFVVRRVKAAVDLRDVQSVLGSFIAKRLTRRRRELIHAEDGLAYAMDGWQAASSDPAPLVEQAEAALRVVSAARKWSYAVLYGPLRAPDTGTYTFELEYELEAGRIAFGAQDRSRRWLPSSWTEAAEVSGRKRSLSLDLDAGQICWLVISNDHPEGDAVSRFTIRGLTSSVVRRDPLRLADVVDRWGAAISRFGARLREAWSAIPRRLSATLGPGPSPSPDLSPQLLAAQEAHRTLQENYEKLQSAYLAGQAELAQLSSLRQLDHIYRLVQERRPESLHLNGCGDFQLMAREHWCELRGYPEFQTFSMNIDALFSSVACYAGIRERVLDSPCHIYHLEHEVGSGWSPEGEALLRRRIAERGITWLDSRDVYLWSAYMHWLNRPMIFNTSDWGFATHPLPDTIATSRALDRSERS